MLTTLRGDIVPGIRSRFRHQVRMKIKLFLPFFPFLFAQVEDVLLGMIWKKIPGIGQEDSIEQYAGCSNCVGFLREHLHCHKSVYRGHLIVVGPNTIPFGMKT